MAPSVGGNWPGMGVVALTLLGVLFQGHAAEDAPAHAAATTASSPTPIVWQHLDALNALRAEGFTCPGGLYFSPNPLLLKFDCNLWRTGQVRLQELDTSNASQLVNLAVAVQSSSAEADAAEEALASFKRSSWHCREMMDPRARLVGVAHSIAGGLQQDERHWVQLFSTEEAPEDTSCFEALALPSLPSAPTLAPTPAPLHMPVVELPPEATERRLKAGAASSGSGSGPSISTATEAPNTYTGPGQTFGMVLLIISVSIFCIGTFGSILIGNCILEARARSQEVSALTTPTP